ncbi:MAG TPA: SET domain-containing protein [Burkholderiaceae bacterium]
METKTSKHLKSWLEASGAYLCAISGVAGDNSEVRARKPLMQGQLVFHVPRQTIIAQQTTLTAPIGKGKTAPDKTVSEFGVLAATLLESCDARRTRQPYVDAIVQENISLPLLGGQEVSNCMRGSAGGRLLEDIRHVTMDDYAALRSAWSRPTPSLMEFTNMRCKVARRAVQVSFGNGPVPALIPIVDQLTHSFSANAYCVEECRGGALVIASENIEAGEPIRIRRALVPNSELFVVYGYPPHLNPHDTTELPLPAPPLAHPLREELMKFGEERGSVRVLILPSCVNEENLQKLLPYFRIWCAENAADIMQVALSVETHQKPTWVSRINEVAAVRAMRDACDACLKHYADGRNDVAEAEHGNSGHGMLLQLLHHARRICDDEKKLLCHWRDFCNSILSAPSELPAGRCQRMYEGSDKTGRAR